MILESDEPLLWLHFRPDVIGITVDRLKSQLVIREVICYIRCTTILTFICRSFRLCFSMAVLLPLLSVRASCLRERVNEGDY